MYSTEKKIQCPEPVGYLGFMIMSYSTASPSHSHKKFSKNENVNANYTEFQCHSISNSLPPGGW